MRHASRLVFLFLIGAVLATAGCGEKDPLVGLYGLEENGKVAEWLRVTKDQEQYSIQVKMNGDWGKPEVVKVMTGEQFEQMFSQKADVAPDEPTGLMMGMGAFVKAPKGFRFQDFETKTGYFILAVFSGLKDLHKID
jgi:hypothetical protein